MGGEHVALTRERIRGAPPGRPLSPDVQARLEPHLGAGLGAVRIHADGHADRLARDLGAEAFTVGSDLYFRSGAFAPHSPRGLKVLAHEAVHVVQQATGRVRGTGTAWGDGLRVSDPGDPFEREASRIATGVIRSDKQYQVPPRHDSGGGGGGGGEVAVQRYVREDFGGKVPAGTPTGKQLTAARTFAAKVSKFGDQARLELLTGDHSKWGKAGKFNAKGKGYLSFLKLLNDPDTLSWAVTHAGNVVEDRVYQLMAKAKMGLPWDPQVWFGSSVPDIVAKLDGDDVLAAIDITSDLGHVLGKVELWTTGRIVYIAEAVFKSVTAGVLTKAKPAILGGQAMDPDELAELERQVAATAKAKAAAQLKERQKRLAEFDQYGTMRAFAEGQFGGSLAEASSYLRAVSVVKKGMSKRTGAKGKGGSALGALDKSKKKTKARQAKYALLKEEREKAIAKKREQAKKAKKKKAKKAK